MKKVFITGGAGYVGGKLVPYFLDNGYTVTVYDIMYFGYQHLPIDNENLNIVAGDIRDTTNLKKHATKYLDIFKDHPYIFNLGHGVLPETNPEMIDYLVKFVKDY